ncbi:repetitive organellar protein isoform X2 [Aethina tumida]|uniref:repetitive organellar protein isoform X2 n=1 Tax=Aethina tumida TaxID=116153 RepID=UPI0021480E9A|nr:repetitive organellar protein isoform X2 [Aethina tumida]
MSETDDTDDLLLIPPDFFVIDTEIDYSRGNLGPYYEIIDNLVTEVINLQDRVGSIETNSDRSLIGSSVDLYDKSRRMSEFRKYNSTDDLYYPISAQSTPQKSPKFRMRSLPASPNIKDNTKRVFSNRRSPRKKLNLDNNTHNDKLKGGGEMLLEIDNFLSKVKTIQRFNTARNLENEFEIYNEESNQLKNMHHIDELLKDLDEQKKHLEDRLKSKEEEILAKEPPIIKKHTWKCEDEDLTGVKNTPDDICNEERFKKSIFVPPTAHLTSNVETRKSPDLSTSSDSTQATAVYNFKGKQELLNNPLHSNAMSILNMHKQLEDSIEETINSNKHGTLQCKSRTENSQLDLISLNDIWNPSQQQSGSVLKHKLNEEKLRRQHCEMLIGDLQQRNLEMQQKIAVAIKVDQAKDSVVNQLRGLLENIHNKLEKSCKDKVELERELDNIKQKYENDLEEARQRVEFYEKETTKALNMAHGNGGKLSTLENKCTELTQELSQIGAKLDEVKENYHNETEKNKQLNDIIASKELELMEQKSLLTQARQEVSSSRETIEICQKELASMRRECDKLENTLKTEKKQYAALTEQQKSLSEQLEKKTKSEKQLKEEINKSKEQINSNKIELRNFYQGQVELLVQNKLKEFQDQLDKAENSFKDELKRKELQIAKTAAIHMQQLTEKYALEIKLMEEKQEEEIKLYQIQIMQYKDEVQALKSKMEHLHERRNLQVQQLQKIMENQWNEALKIIANAKCPSPTSQYEQLNSLKAKSYNNLEEVLSQDEHFLENNINPSRNKVFFNENTRDDKGSGFKAESRRLNFDDTHNETPISSRMPLSDNDLQKIIHMLINSNKAPDSHGSKPEINSTNPSTNDKPTWPSLNQEDQSRTISRDGRLGKPMWK